MMYTGDKDVLCTIWHCSALDSLAHNSATQQTYSNSYIRRGHVMAPYKLSYYYYYYYYYKMDGSVKNMRVPGQFHSQVDR